MQIVEINRSGINISVSKGFLVISDKENIQKIPLDNVECLILNSYGAQLSNRTLIRILEFNIPLIICGNNSAPIGMLLSTSKNVFRKQRIETQISMSKPLCKQLWQTIIKAKLINQAAVLRIHKIPCKDIEILAKNVRSGDSENSEAVAARRYWPRLFGDGFIRNPDLPGVNSFLNYGYAIIRAAISRSIVGSGFLPELGIHHTNKMNPFCLSDDLMEPFRPFVDNAVKNMNPDDESPLTSEKKKTLASILNKQLYFEGKTTNLRQCMESIINLFSESLLQKKALLRFPLPD